MYWELWLSQVTASSALMPCMLIQDKGGQALSCVNWEIFWQEINNFSDVISNVSSPEEPSLL